MQMEWKRAITRFLLNNLGQMDQEDVEIWLNDELDLAPLLEPPLKVQAQYRDQIMRELHQISPAEVFDLFQKEHPELVFPDGSKVVVKIGRELEALKDIVRSL